MLRPPLSAFCIDYPGIARELVTDIVLVPKYPSTEEIIRQVISNPLETTFRAIWDTGATHSVVTQRVIDKLNLSQQVIEFTEVHSVNSDPILKPVYIVGGIILPNRVMFMPQRFIESDIGGNYDVLIGMDIIAMGELTLSGYGGRTKFCFSYPPHHKRIDLKERNEKVNKRKK